MQMPLFYMGVLEPIASHHILQISNSNTPEDILPLHASFNSHPFIYLVSFIGSSPSNSPSVGSRSSSGNADARAFAMWSNA